MKNRNLSIKRKSRVRRERDPIPWKYCMLTMVCGLILVLGFFAAARQHFSSIDCGIQNAKLRKELDSLNSQKRRLMLAREVSLSPGEITKAAKKFGLRGMTARNIEAVNRRKPVELELAENISIKNIKPIETLISKPLVQESVDPKEKNVINGKKGPSVKGANVTKLVSVRKTRPTFDEETIAKVEPVSKARKR